MYKYSMSFGDKANVLLEPGHPNTCFNRLYRQIAPKNLGGGGVTTLNIMVD